MEEAKNNDATTAEYRTGVDTANFFEAVKAQVDKEYKPQNWDLASGVNRFEGKNPQEMIEEYRLCGHSSKSSLDLLLQRAKESYPDEGQRTDFVNGIMNELKDKLS